LMEHLAGYNRALIIDAIITHQVPVGTVSVFNLKDLPDQAAGHLSSSHDTTLQKALQVGRTMGVDLPEQITIIAIEAETVFDFSEELTPAVAAVVPQATQTVLDILHQEEQIP
jgi:hydrogenase maturation protease